MYFVIAVVISLVREFFMSVVSFARYAFRSVDISVCLSFFSSFVLSFSLALFL